MQLSSLIYIISRQITDLKYMKKLKKSKQNRVK